MARGSGGVSVQVTWADGLSRFDFDQRAVKFVMRAIGRDLKANAARILRSRRGVSKPGETPGRDTGAYSRSIVANVSRSGFSVGVSPTRKTLEKAAIKSKRRKALSTFYPAILSAGSKHLRPRTSPTSLALERRQAAYRSALSNTLIKAIKPAFEK